MRKTRHINKPCTRLGVAMRHDAALCGTRRRSALGRIAPPPTTPDCEARLEGGGFKPSRTHPRVKDVPRATIKATTEFTTGNMLFVLLHEAAHGLISDLGLPVLGREEDAADAFATVTMLEMKTEFTHRTLVNAAKSWMISDRRSREKPRGGVLLRCAWPRPPACLQHHMPDGRFGPRPLRGPGRAK